MSKKFSYLILILLIFFISSCKRQDDASEEYIFPGIDYDFTDTIQEYNDAASPAADFEYELDRHYASIIKYVGADDKVIIPSMIEDKIVTYIGQEAFAGHEEISEIVFPDTIFGIEANVFEETQWYKGLPDGPVYIGRTYYNYKGNMPDSYELIIDEGTLGIASQAFYNNEAITRVEFPETLKFISGYAFAGSSNLETISIPADVYKIGAANFIDCSSLKEIKVDSGNKNYSDKKGVLFNKSKDTLVAYPAGKAEITYKIPRTVTTIERWCFYGCDNLEDIVPSRKLSTIGPGAFINAGWYEQQPDGVIYFGNILYNYKGEMPSNFELVIESGIKIIAESAFMDCEELKSIVIPNSVTTINDFAFSNATALETIYLSHDLNHWSLTAFEGCDNVKKVRAPTVYDREVIKEVLGEQVEVEFFSYSDLIYGAAGEGVYELYNEATQYEWQEKLHVFVNEMQENSIKTWAIIVGSIIGFVLLLVITGRLSRFRNNKWAKLHTRFTMIPGAVIMFLLLQTRYRTLINKERIVFIVSIFLIVLSYVIFAFISKKLVTIFLLDTIWILLFSTLAGILANLAIAFIVAILTIFITLLFFAALGSEGGRSSGYALGSLTDLNESYDFLQTSKNSGVMLDKKGNAHHVSRKFDNVFEKSGSSDPNNIFFKDE